MTTALEKIEQTAEVLKAMEKYVDAAAQDYVRFAESTVKSYGEGLRGTVEQQVEDFRKTLEFQVGKKWIKVIRKDGQTMVHGFVCIEPLKGFKVGDLAKPASWHQPAKNFSRGNVLTGDVSRVRWTGVL